MLREHQNRRAFAGLVVCFVVAAVIVLAAGGLHELRTNEGLNFAVAVSMLTAVTLVLAGAMFLPYGFIVLGWMRLQQDKLELASMPDDNVVGDPEAGERKLHDYLTAISSTEARIGLLQRSDPYIPPARRAPDGAKPPRVIMSKLGWNLISGTILAGGAAGVALGMYHGLGAGGEYGLGFVQLSAASLVGMVLASPVGVTLALLFGRIEVEGRDDARSSGSEAA
jgi:hypothetical protein